MAKQDLKQIIRELMVPSDLTPLYRNVGTIIVNSWKRNFHEGGRYGDDNKYGGGSKKWEPSRRALGLVKSRHTGRKGKGLTLVDTNYLRGSISSRPTRTGVRVGTNAPYGWKHHEGADGMVRRPIFVLQNEDLDDIHDAVISFYAKRMRSN